MDQELQNLIRHLQNEKCPPAVLSRVRQHISREQPPASFWRGSVARVVAIACLLGTVALWQWQAERDARRVTAEEKANRARVVEQTQAAIGYIGQALIRAAARTENVLAKEAVPPIQNSFEIVKNKLTNPI